MCEVKNTLDELANETLENKKINKLEGIAMETI